MSDDLQHNIFDGASTSPVVENTIVLVEWRDNTEQVFGPYSQDEAIKFGEDLANSNENVQSWTTLPLRKP